MRGRGGETHAGAGAAAMILLVSLALLYVSLVGVGCTVQ